MKIFILSGGKLDCDRSVIHPGDDSHRRVLLPVGQVLIQHDGQTILVDTGCPICAAGDPDGLQRELGIDRAWINPQIGSHERVDEQLARLGLQLSDLTMVINTHFHFDHAGGNDLFAGVPITAQEAEILGIQENGNYPSWWSNTNLQFRAVQGDWSPLPGVQMLLTPGHTPGHQSMLVRLGEQPWLFTFDAVYTEEHWRENKLGAVQDVAQARASMGRLRQIAGEENARIIFGHDLGQWEALEMPADGAPKLVAQDGY